MEPCISIVIPAFNCAKTISMSIESALLQEGVKEIIIIDDCSTDTTEQIVDEFCQKTSLIRYEKNKNNSGAAVSRNRGVQLASSNYIAFLDADDYWEKGKLAAQYELMQKTGAVICSTSRELIKADGTKTGQILPIKDRISYKELLKHNSLSCSAILARRDVLLEFPMEHEDSHEDYITWLKIVKKYGYAVGLNQPYLKYRLSNQSKSGSKFKSARMTFQVYRHIGLSLPKSILCFLSYTWHGIIKYYIKNGN